MRWWILDEKGSPILEEALEPRPDDAIKSDDPFAPWHIEGDHVHLNKDGSFNGVHAYGTLRDALKFFADNQALQPSQY